MKKVIALLAVCGFAIALVACGKKAEEASTTTDSTTTVVETTVDTTAVDTTKVAVDTTAVKK
jgi:ABC-type Zn uptake system ZnuABC Zn-binding protein ZnuA